MTFRKQQCELRGEVYRSRVDHDQRHESRHSLMGFLIISRIVVVIALAGIVFLLAAAR